MIPIIAVIAMVVIDQVVKYWAFTDLQPKSTIPVIENIFHLTYVENRGAAFSILQNQIWLFVLLTICILAMIIIAIKRGKIRTALGRWGLYLVAGGAIGNLIDRVLRGFVVDLFDFRYIHFPVFNIADIFVCVGAVLFCVYIMVQHDKR